MPVVVGFREGAVATSCALSLPLEPLTPSALSRQEDVVLLRHALQCGTKQWGELSHVLQQQQQQHQKGGVGSHRSRSAALTFGGTVQCSRSLASGCAQQGKRSRVQPAPWPRIGSESAFPDGVLLGISIKDHMPGDRTPHAALPVPLRSQVTALGGSFPGAKSRCICRKAPHDKCFNRQTPVQPTASCHWLACCSLAPHTPVSPLCLPGPAYHLPVRHPLCAVALRAPDALLPEGRELQGPELAAFLYMSELRQAGARQHGGGSHTAQLLRVLGWEETLGDAKEKGEMCGRGEGAAGASREAESSRGWEQSVIDKGEVGSGE
ncbi:unnamed protein product [Closterium sp. Naga37s-1]|nr:unnamed protein product [Closterium sp. Naga37s-1]